MKNIIFCLFLLIFMGCAGNNDSKELEDAKKKIAELEEQNKKILKDQEDELKSIQIKNAFDNFHLKQQLENIKELDFSIKNKEAIDGDKKPEVVSEGLDSELDRDNTDVLKEKIKNFKKENEVLGNNVVSLIKEREELKDKYESGDNNPNISIDNKVFEEYEKFVYFIIEEHNKINKGTGNEVFFASYDNKPNRPYENIKIIHDFLEKYKDKTDFIMSMFDNYTYSQ